MPATPFDSAIYGDLFGDAELARLFSDSAEIRAMLLVEGALAKAQGSLGLIPELSAAAIHRDSLELQLDPGGLAAETGQSAVVVPALIKAFRTAMLAPEHSQHVHFGATSQDIMDTGLILRLRQVLAIYKTRLQAVTRTMGTLAKTHANLPIAARTYGQIATVTSFGAVVAGWGNPCLRHLTRLTAVRDDLLVVGLSGAAGTLSAMGHQGTKVRELLAEGLGLSDPGASWHSQRDRIGALSSWITGLAVSLGKIGEDLTLMTQSGINEVTLGQGGGSSTMPQKFNPVMPALLVALARQTVALNSVMQGTGLHRQQRDGAAWMGEWMTLPQMCLGLGRALNVVEELLRGLTPNPAKMTAGIDDGKGLIYAEALSFALARHMPRHKAQAAVKELCQKAMKGGASLADRAGSTWPDHNFDDVFTPTTQMGTAPDEARAFAAQAAAI